MIVNNDTNDVVVRTHLPQHVVDLLNSVANTCQTTRSQLIRYALYQWLDSEGLSIDNHEKVKVNDMRAKIMLKVG